jgi:hypothetical protein
MAYPDFKLGSVTDFQAQLTRIGPLALRVSSSPSSSRHWWQFRKQK